MIRDIISIINSKLAEAGINSLFVTNGTDNAWLLVFTHSHCLTIAIVDNSIIISSKPDNNDITINSMINLGDPNLFDSIINYIRSQH